MKKIEDIERMSDDALLEASADVPVPEGLQERIKATLAAAESADVRRPLRWAPWAAVAAAAAIAAAIVLPRPALKDTFEDPYLAYAQVEATFQDISGKMATGVMLAENARTVAGKPIEIMNKITEK